MPDALNNESFPVGRDMAAGHDVSNAASAAAANGRRISASSFKLLTAKLKSSKTTQPLPVAESPPMLVEPSESDLVKSLAGSNSTFDVDALTSVFVPLSPGIATALPAFQPLTPDALQPGEGQAPLAANTDIEPHAVDVVDAVSPALIEEAVETRPVVEVADLLPEPPPSVSLPEFTPVEWLNLTPDEDPPIEAETTGSPVPYGIGMSADELPSISDLPPLPAFVPDAQPSVVAEAVPQDVAVQPAADDVVAEIANLESPPELELETEAENPDEAGMLDTGTVETVTEPVPIDSDVSHQLEPIAAAPASGQAESPAALLETEALQAYDSEPEAEVRTATSEMAGRVVDAMIKTISTAIYAKPSSSERAAFLREVAILMQEATGAAGANEGPNPPHGEPITPAAIPPARPAPTVSVTPAEADRPELLAPEAIAERIGPAPLLKTSPAHAEQDPFAQSAVPSRLIEAKPAETVDADEESGDLALTLLDMMSGGTGSLPHERTLAADTLLRILPRIPVKQLLSVVERVAIMETPPALLVAKLIRDTRAEIVGPLLERCSHISDQDLMNAAPDGDITKLRMVARRRILSTVLSDFLISTGEAGVLLTLIRNPGATLSHDAFFRLAEEATKHHGLLAPLATRADLPPPVAFELFWHVPQELRRFIFSRFLTDSEMLNKILRITMATHGNDGGDAMGDGKFPPRDAVDAAVGLAATYKLEAAAHSFGELAGIARETTLRILADREGEPITVLLKALGSSRARFEEALTRLRLGEAGLLRLDRNPEELQAIFDGLSFNKARILLTYWDWFVRKAGPYAPHN